VNFNTRSFTRISVAKVVRPAHEMPVETVNHLRQWHKAVLRIGHLAQFLPLSFERLVGYGHIEVALLPPLQIAIIAKRVSREVRLHSLCLRSITRVFSRLISSPIQSASFDSIHPLSLSP